MASQATVSPPIDYYNNGPGIIASTAVLAVIATIVVVLRFWARKLTRTHLGLDDYLVLSALLVHYACTAGTYASVIGGGVGQDFRLVEMEGPDKIVILYKSLFASEILYGLSSPLVKLAVIALIWRIFPTRTIRIAGMFTAIAVLAWTVAILTVNLLQCQPLQAFWQPERQTLPTIQCLNFILFFLCNSAINTVIDFITVFLPIHEVLKLQLSRSKKYAVCGIFLLGGAAFTASLTRTISTAVIYHQGITNFTKQFVVSGVVTTIEIYIGIIGACVPLLAPVYHRLRPGKAYEGTSSKRKPLTGGSSYRLKSHKTRTRQRPYNPLHDDDLASVLNTSHGRQVDIYGQGLYSSQANISLQGIIVKQDIE
ncbi:hypothetical protein F5Y16DRAFT_33994 [Xylariaceae sp. FL0255]|nr:hypothetical protein F5Y16DRAFT_33994 [Xylariaceae sp. FL0255]